MTDQSSVALIGYGLAGSVFHAPLIAAVPELRLSHVVTSSAERATQATSRHPGVRVVDSADQLWQEAAEIDLVVIASPNRTHVPLAEVALDHGLGVVIDKPMAATAAAGRLLVERAQARGRLLSVFQNRRWDGDFLTVSDLITRGRLGRVHRFESRFERWRPEVDHSRWRERPDPEEAGGLLYDLGSHLVDQALHLLGPAHRVYAEVSARRPGADVDDDVFIGIHHAQGGESHLWASALAAQAGPRFRVLGDAAAFTCWGLDPQEQQLRDGARPLDAGFGRFDPATWGELGADGDLQQVPTIDGSYVEYYRAVATALREGAPAPVDPRDAVAGLMVLEAARRSAHDGVVVELS